MKRANSASDRSMQSEPVPVPVPVPVLWLSACLVVTAVLSCAIHDESDLESAVADPPPVREAAAEDDGPAPLPDLAPLPELEIGDDAPLLLDGVDADPGESAPAVATATAAANQACFHCHANYEEDPFVERHAREEIGCADCHGNSLAHQNDENNITPPEVMFPLPAIAEACGVCHDSHNAPATEVLARWQARCPENTDPDQVVCTDCHGKHRLRIRTVRWNRRTGELLSAEPPAGAR